MPYAVYEKVEEQKATLGQAWRDEDIVENIALCRFQPIGKAFEMYLDRKSRILEAGCGMGRWVFWLREKGYDIVGIDGSEDAVAQAKSHDPTARIYLSDVVDTSFQDGAFDAVISLGVMEHFIDGPQAVLAETRRLLGAGGHLFVTVPPANALRRMFTHPVISLKKRVKEIMGRKLSFAEYRYRADEFSAHLRDAGFDILEILTDELELPRNMGLYSDFPRLRHSALKWHLNGMGVAVARFLRVFSEDISRGGVLFVCRKSAAGVRAGKA